MLMPGLGDKWYAPTLANRAERRFTSRPVRLAPAVKRAPFNLGIAMRQPVETCLQIANQRSVVGQYQNAFLGKELAQQPRPVDDQQRFPTARDTIHQLKADVSTRSLRFVR